MDQEVIYRTQIQPLVRDPLPSVTTHLICRNTLLRTGIGQILSGSRFILTDEAFDDPSRPLVLLEGAPALILLCESLSLDAYLEELEKVKARCPSARVVILADHLDLRTVVQLCTFGLNGLCPTAMSQAALLKALELVMLGETFLPASVSFELLEQGSCRLSPVGIPMPASVVPGSVSKLSERETEILRCLTQGASNKLIARELGLAEATVKVHIKAILRKVKADNRTQAAMWAQAHLISADCAG
ncbi:LuxR C-terminal-related transcriptional regulator [Microvirga arabica]|uniref:LuxR C-terminal-related transcriptional regulator n=1 Tax=Microvirga arabica TaxID=1128671 RepID=A0ABV6Y9Z5_9HYPH